MTSCGHGGGIPPERRILDAAEADGVEADRAAGKSKYLGREVAEHLRADKRRIARRKVFEAPAGEQERGHLRLAECRIRRRAQLDAGASGVPVMITSMSSPPARVVAWTLRSGSIVTGLAKSMVPDVIV